MIDDDDTQRIEQSSVPEIESTIDMVLLHVLGEISAAVSKAVDLLSQLEHLALDIRSAHNLHRASMAPESGTESHR